MRKLGIAMMMMMLLVGMAAVNVSVAQTSAPQSAADQAQQGADQTQGEASSTADQAQGTAEKAAGGVTGAVKGAGKAVGKGVETGAEKTKEFFTGNKDKEQDQSGAAVQNQSSGGSSGTSAQNDALPQTGSLLPLLGLLGLSSVSFGVWKSRFHR